MRMILSLGILTSLIFAVNSKAVSIPNKCYTTLEGTQFCTHDNLKKIQVLVFNAGWCGPCNNEMEELAPASAEFEGKSVVFASLSGEGWSHGQKPDATFLKEWKDRHSIPFVVAGTFKDFGKDFGAQGFIPFAAIVDGEGNVTKSGSLSAAAITSEVRRLLDSMKETEVNAQAFFESIKGGYHIQSIKEGTRADSATITMDPELPNTAIVSMPYCVEDQCFDSGNLFDYGSTKVIQKDTVYTIELKAGEKTLKYTWEAGMEGTTKFSNLQFIGPSGKVGTLTHTLKK